MKIKKANIIILVIIFFLAGILLDRAFLYYEMGEKNKDLLKEQEVIKKEYEILINRFEMVEQEIQQSKLKDSTIIE